MTVLIIDNEDSFTHNIAHAIHSLGVEVVVLHHRMGLDRVTSTNPTHLVISPGPGHPENQLDIGVSGAAIGYCQGSLPILGICLGMQIICTHKGYPVVSSKPIHHGLRSTMLTARPSVLHANLPQAFEVMRYHSFEVGDSDHARPVTGRAVDDNAIMSVEWPALRIYGTQYHPESVGSPYGRAVLHNFLERG